MPAAQPTAFSSPQSLQLTPAWSCPPVLQSSAYCRVSAYKVPAGQILANKSRMFANCKAAAKFIGNPVAQKDGCVLVKQVRTRACRCCPAGQPLARFVSSLRATHAMQHVTCLLTIRLLLHRLMHLQQVASKAAWDAYSE